MPIRMKIIRMTVLGMLPAMLGAQEYLGAGKVLERLAARSVAEVDAEKKPDPVQELRRRVEEFKSAAATLAPAEAATRWLALLDAYLSLSMEALHASLGDQGVRLGLHDLVMALPPSEAWPGLIQSLNQRKSGKPLQDSLLRLLGAVLAGDVAAWERDLAGLEKLVAEEKLETYQRRHYRQQIEQLTKSLKLLSGSPEAVLQSFERQLVEMEKDPAKYFAERGGYLQVPDLMRFGNAEAVRPLLLRALKLGAESFSVEGKATRAQAADLALQAVEDLKQPPWLLVHRLQDAALYEALVRKFPGSAGREREEASEMYWVALIASGRTDDAVKHLEEELKAQKDGRFGMMVKSLDAPEFQGLAAPLHDFLKVWLQKRPEWPLWPTYIALAARESASAEALALMKEVMARPGLDAGVRRQVADHFHLALLAADEREEGVRLLRELVQAGPSDGAGGTGGESAEVLERLRKAGVKATPEMLARVTQRLGSLANGGWREHLEVCGRLAELGRLLEEPEWVEQGLAAALAILEKETSGRDAYLRRSLVTQVVSLLMKHGRGLQAEAVLLAELERQVTPAPEPQRHMGNAAVGELLMELVAVYDAADRHADVLQLLERSTHWGAADIVDIESMGGSAGKPMLLMAARALHQAGRKDEARRVLRRALQNHPARDDVYALAFEVEDAEGMRSLLEWVERQDRFEERPLIWKAQLHLSAGRLEEAEATIRAAIAIDPSDGEQGKGDRMRAYAVLAEVLERRGDAATAAVMRGAVSAVRKSEAADDWWSAGLLTEAVRRYEEALLDFADAYCIQSRLALRYSEMGEFEKAEQHYLRAFELMPDSFGRVESHCFGCEGAFRGERAQNVADKVFSALAAKPGAKAQVHYLLGYLRKSQGKPEEAVAAYRLAVQQDPDYLNAWSKLLALAGEVQLPLDECEKAALEMLRLDPAGRRGGASLQFVRNLPLLWTRILEAEKALPVVESGPLWELAASKAEIERRRDAAPWGGHRFRMPDEGGLRQQLVSHPAIQQLIMWLESLRQY